MIFYEENFSSKIKNIDSSFIKLVYSFHSAYQEREIGSSMKREKSVDDMRVNQKSPYRATTIRYFGPCRRIQTLLLCTPIWTKIFQSLQADVVRFNTILQAEVDRNYQIIDFKGHKL